MKILLTEDDTDIANNIGLYFEQKGHILDYAFNGPLGLKLALEEKFDLIILDLMLPGMDGISVCEKIREQSQDYTPIIMLTARDTLADKESGFTSGADDYLVKPFSLRELELRIEALLRRPINKQPSRLKVGDLELDPKTRQVSRSGQLIYLKPKAFKILETLLINLNDVVPRQVLVDRLWPDDPPDGDPLRVHIHHLRQQVDMPFDQQLIKTVHGIGYCISETSLS